MAIIDLSITRQSTTVEAGKPLLISGRCSFLGVGSPLPFLIRVTVSGPKYDPVDRHFDTFSSPFTGDYSINVLAEKDGEYDVYAKAYPPAPSLPLIPDPLLLGPSLAESTKPPIVVGTPTPEGLIETITEVGRVETISAPSPVYVEVPVMVEVAAPRVQAAPTQLPSAPPSIPLSELPRLEKQAYVPIIEFTPNTMLAGDIADGIVVWDNKGTRPTTFDVNLYLVDITGQGYGPFQAATNVLVPTEGSASATISIDTAILPAGIYSARADVIDVDTGSIIASRSLPQRLTLIDITDIDVDFPDLGEGESGETKSGTIVWSPV